MNHHSLVCRLGVGDTATVKPSRSDSKLTEVSFVDGDHRLGYGLGQALDQLRELGLHPSERTVDLALLAAALTAADTRISRSSESQNAWTREIDLCLPVAEPKLWETLAPLIVTTLNFLTGDRWGVRFRARPKGLAALAPAPTKLRTATADSVCLFSGGLDSFIGAIDLLAGGKAPMLVSHYWDGITSTHQTYCANVIAKRFAAAQALGFEPPALTLRRTQSASLSLLRRLTEPYSKPVFGIDNVEIDGVEHTVNEEVIVQRPFCRLLRFDVANRQEAPHVLLVAPMAGHYATLLRETVRDLLPAYTVFITDWADAREVPMHEGGFDLDDYINYLVAFVRQLGPTTHLVAVCQAGVPAAATVALLEGGSIGDGVPPASLTVMGSPIDVSRSPTQVNQLAAGHDDGWFADTLITTVPARFPGAHVLCIQGICS